MVIACGLTVSVSLFMFQTLVHVSDSQSINRFCLVSSPGKNHFFVFVYMYTQYVTLKSLHMFSQMIANLRPFHRVITNDA